MVRFLRSCNKCWKILCKNKEKKGDKTQESDVKWLKVNKLAFQVSLEKREEPENQ